MQKSHIYRHKKSPSNWAEGVSSVQGRCKTREQANLSQIELENIDAIYAYEQERGSSYVS